MSIQYYGLAKDEELPEEFCAIRHEHGEPSEYHWYIPEPRVETDETGFVTHVEIDGRWYVPERTRLEAENAELRELVHMMLRVAGIAEYATDAEWQVIARYLSKLGIEVEP